MSIDLVDRHVLGLSVDVVHLSCHFDRREQSQNYFGISLDLTHRFPAGSISRKKWVCPIFANQPERLAYPSPEGEGGNVCCRPQNNQVVPDDGVGITLRERWLHRHRPDGSGLCRCTVFRFRLPF